MADNVWTNAGADNNGNNAGNWSLARVPTVGDTAVYDGTTSNDDCTFSGPISCDGARYDSGYTGTVDGNGQTITLGADGMNTSAGAGGLVLGDTATWICEGSWDDTNLAVYARDAATTVRMTGSGVTIVSDARSRTKRILEIVGNVVAPFRIDPDTLLIQEGGVLEFQGAVSTITELATIHGTLIDSTSYMNLTNASMVVEPTGTITGGTSFRCFGSTITLRGTWTLGLCLMRRNCTVIGDGGIFDGAIHFESNQSGHTAVLQGNIVITGEVLFESATTHIYGIDTSTHNPTLEFHGNATWSVDTGSLDWSPGTGPIRFAGTTDSVMTTPTGWTNVLNGVVIDKAIDVAQFRLASDPYVLSFSGIQGRCDLAAYKVTSSGNVAVSTAGGFQFHNGSDNSMAGGSFALLGGALTLDGSPASQLQIKDLNFDLSSGASGTATYSDVSDSVATGTGAPIDATHPTNNDLGGNVGWNFAAVGEIFELDPGAFNLSGFELETPYAAVFTLELGSFGLNGFDLAAIYQPPPFQLDIGTFALQGFELIISAEVQQFALEPGAFALAGFPLDFVYAAPESLEMDRGDYSLAGFELEFVYTPPETFYLDPGAYGLVGYDLEVIYTPPQSVDMDLGEFAVVGFPLDMRYIPAQLIVEILRLDSAILRSINRASRLDRKPRNQMSSIATQLRLSSQLDLSVSV